MAQELDGDALCDVVMSNFEARTGQQQVLNQPQYQPRQPTQGQPRQPFLPQEPVPIQGFSASQQLPMRNIGNS